MRVHLSLVVFAVALAGCNGIEHSPTGPTPPPRSQAAVQIRLVPTPGELPAGGGSASILVEAVGIDGLGVSTPVALAVSDGSLGTASVTTDGTGHAIASWQGTKTTSITATSGEAISVVTLTVRTPVELPPPSVPPPPTPTPEPTPIPTPQPAITVSLVATPPRVPVGGTSILSATVSNLGAGETVIAYQWDWEGDQKIDDTGIASSREHPFPIDGIITPTVRVLTSSGRSATGSGQVVVFKTLR